MTSDEENLIAQLEEATAQLSMSPASPPNREVFTALRTRSRDTHFLSTLDRTDLQRLVATFVKIPLTDNVPCQLDCVATIANVLCINVALRQDEAAPTILGPMIPVLYSMLDLVSERRINSESQYNEFIPIFRLYFFLLHIKPLLPLLRDSVLKIGSKLLNFVTMSTLDSTCLNAIIIEILKIVYTNVHQVDDTSGLDSYFVLSCNKFNLIYAKHTATTPQYDEILQHYGNLLMAIPTTISQNYMLNKVAFARNQVTLINKVITGEETLMTSPVPALLTLEVLLTIDAGDNADIEQDIQDRLNFKRLTQLVAVVVDPYYKTVLQQVQARVALKGTLEEAAEYRAHAAEAEEKSIRQQFEELSPEEQEQEITKMNDLFERIEKNGVFKIQTK